MKSHPAAVLGKKSHRKWREDIYRYVNGISKDIDDMIRMWSMSAFVELSQGKRVRMPGLGTFQLKFRNGCGRKRTFRKKDGTTWEVVQKDTFRVFFNTSHKLRKALSKLAEQYNSVDKLPKTYGKSLRANLRDAADEYIKSQE